MKSYKKEKKLIMLGGSSKCLYKQSRINIGSDGTLAQAPVWIGLKRGPQFIFWGPYISK